jgi:predicted metal-dependent phosphoesterase TrpH
MLRQLFLLTLTVAVPAAFSIQREPTTVTLSGIVTAQHKGTYQEHPFIVPAGVTRIDVEFTYQNKGAGTELEIGVFDPQRFRGTSRFSKDRFHIGEFEATPSYVPGPLVPGTWRLSLGIPSIGATMTSEWRATIRFSTERTPREGLAPILKAEPGWYVGDLHAHTLHSDGFGCRSDDEAVNRGCQPWEVVEAGRAKTLDFLAITDHNTTTHHADLATLQESMKTMLLLRGQELTTFHGHANVYGTSRVIDFRLGFNQRSMADVMTDVEREGALLSINHPGRETGDRCTGCGWDAPQTPWPRIQAMEVINGGVIEGKTAGMPFWYARLNEGHRITAIGGSDDHGARSPRSRVGSPATVIYASALSEAALLEGIRSGRVYVRTRGPEGPILEVTGAPASGHNLDVQLTMRIARAAGQSVEIVRNGEVVAMVRVDSADTTLTHVLSLGAGTWVHVRLRNDQGITAFSNPIYGSVRP